MDNIRTLSGIKLHYAREPQFPYGTSGRPATFQIERSFKNKLKSCFEETFSNCPLSKPNIITCAGIYVNKEGSQHRFGRAFDFDAAFWNNYNLVTRNFHHDRELYLGIESYLRVYFGIVLNYFYNNDHKDHWHIDNSRPVDFNTNSRSSVLYVQLVLSYIYEKPVEVDGIYGPQSASILREVLDRLNLTGSITTPNTYKAFLRRTGKIAFEKFDQKKSPLRLFNNIYDVISGLELDSGSNMMLHQALNNFRNHTETEAWLSNQPLTGDIESIIDSVI